jgi:hypothetical protein
VFIDPDGDNHNYYEFEMNAYNTIWELTLVKPYKDGGPALSPTNLQKLASSVYIDGKVCDDAACVLLTVRPRGTVISSGMGVLGGR